MDHNFGTTPVEAYQDRARKLVRAYVLTHLEKTDPTPDFTAYLVWFSKTLDNWKALVSTTLPDKMYYEVTYNGAKKEAYIDAYLKVDNQCVRDSEWPNQPSFFDGLNPAGDDRFA